MRNFTDAEIGITRDDLRRIIEYWYNEKCKSSVTTEDRRIELVRISPDAKYVVRFNVLSTTVAKMRAEKENEPEAEDRDTA